jgi:hypothetical protein
MIDRDDLKRCVPAMASSAYLLAPIIRFRTDENVREEQRAGRQGSCDTTWS